MADSALFLGWGSLKTGREKTAFAVFDESVQFFAGCQQQGRIDSFEPFALELHGGELSGFFLLRADLDKLNQLRYSDDFIRILDRASNVVNDLGVVTAFTGNRLQQLFATGQQNISDIVE